MREYIGPLPAEMIYTTKTAKEEKEFKKIIPLEKSSVLVRKKKFDLFLLSPLPI